MNNFLTRCRRVPLFLILTMLVACSARLSQPQGDPVIGQRLFSGELLTNQTRTPACASCHTVTIGEQPALGLNMSNIGNRASTRVPGQSAEEYLRTSILQPDAYLAGGFQEGIMYQNYSKDFSPQQVEDLVAYLLSLRSGQD